LARAYDMEPGPVARAVHFSLDEVFLEEDIVVVVVCVRGCGVNIDGGYLGRESGVWELYWMEFATASILESREFKVGSADLIDKQGTVLAPTTDSCCSDQRWGR
jgi:hypothetical protein